VFSDFAADLLRRYHDISRGWIAPPQDANSRDSKGTPGPDL